MRIKINKNSDFSIPVRFSYNGKQIVVPPYPWRVIFRTDTTHSFNSVTASFDGKEFINCIVLNDYTVLVILKDHKLGIGMLNMELQMDLPTNNVPFTNGTFNVSVPFDTGFELWEGPSDCIIPKATIEANIAYMLEGKSAYQQALDGGYKGTEDEFYATLGNLGRVPQESYVPQSRVEVSEKGTIYLNHTSPAPQEARYYVGVQSYVRKAYRLIQHPITGMQHRLIDLSEYLTGVGFQPLPEATRDQNGVLSGKIDLLKLLDSEFVPLTALEDAGFKVAADNDISSMQRPLAMRFFCRGRFIRTREELSTGIRYSRSLHNLMTFDIRASEGDFHGGIGVDRVTKGNKQVVRRIYKVGFVRPKSFLADGVTPDWNGGYFSSNWHNILVERVIYIYTRDASKDYAVVRVV